MNGPFAPMHVLRVLCGAALMLGAATWTQGCTVSRLDRLLAGVPSSPAASFRNGREGVILPAISTDETLDHKRRMNLSQCIQVALEHRPETRGTWLIVRAAAAGVGRAKAAYLPSLDLSAQAAVGDPLEPSSPQAKGVSYVLEANLGIHYLLFDGGGRAAGVAAAKANLVVAGLTHNAKLRKVVRSVELAYYGLLATEQQEGIARQSVRQATEHVALAKARRENDVALRLDVMQAETAKAEATLAWVRARSQTRLARGQLAHAMGLSPTVGIRVAAVPPHDPFEAVGRIRALLQEAAAHRPELSAARAKVSVARAKTRGARSRYWPVLTLNAQAGVQLRKASTQYTNWTVGLGITFPFFDGLDREYAIRQARLEAARNETDVVGVARDIEMQVWTAFASLKEAAEAIRAARTLVQSAKESVATAEGQYREGVASIIALVDAQTAHVRARLQLVQARLAWYAGMAELRWAVGRFRETAPPRKGQPSAMHSTVNVRFHKAPTLSNIPSAARPSGTRRPGQ